MSTSYTERWNHSLMNNYGTPPITLVRGEGAYVFDDEGNKYLDLLAGIAVNILGHAHPRVVEAVSSQIKLLGHTSNLYGNDKTIALAERLLALTGREGKVFFCNSGAEANEAAFKISRLTGRTKIVAAEGAFHGRTMGSLALTGQPPKQAPFMPLPGDVTHVPYGDTAAAVAAIDEQTAMVILEPIMGEGGVQVPPAGYLRAVQDRAHAVGALFVLDEVQTGIARTGNWFAYQSDDLQPDVITLAKGLGAGMPIGATIAFGAAGDLFTAGSHGTTFGGNPVCAAAALAVLDAVVDEDLLSRTKDNGAHLVDAVTALGHPLVTEVRGEGMLRAIGLSADVAGTAQNNLRDKGFLVNAVAPNAIRLAPPLIVDRAQLDTFVAALPDALKGE
ncbi:acetylornithine aminotransferase [Antricoccus suffuscus]|uniref:Acetylornithine aminotransferase n=1 Tax=Antricoccus suffuscus TaxID=1629062 RepID=A0A2T0ZWE4_9ACTN|nr:acetylornithine transaminase [Antricoccus suffuscus]PRZ40685.1 acetylornithine aminotransferase [Antricoccus suffuscus]